MRHQHPHKHHPIHLKMRPIFKPPRKEPKLCSATIPPLKPSTSSIPTNCPQPHTTLHYSFTHNITSYTLTSWGHSLSPLSGLGLHSILDSIAHAINIPRGGRDVRKCGGGSDTSFAMWRRREQRVRRHEKRSQHPSEAGVQEWKKIEREGVLVQEWEKGRGIYGTNCNELGDDDHHHHRHHHHHHHHHYRGCCSCCSCRDAVELEGKAAPLCKRGRRYLCSL